METRPHVMVLPFPAHGHIDPMLTLSLHLAVRGGFIVTFVNTRKAHERMLLDAHSKDAEEGVGVRFVCIPDGTDEPLPGQEGPPAIDSLLRRLEGIAAQQGLLEDMVLASRTSPNPIASIVSDAFFPWTTAMATKLRIAHALYWSSSPAALALALNLKKGVPIEDSLPSDARDAFPPRHPDYRRVFGERVAALHHTSCVVLNAFHDLLLATPDLQAAASTCEPSTRCLGPLFPPRGPGLSVTPIAFFEQHSTTSCMPWLDQHAAGSVLYISFGSLFSPSLPQLQELALGIELSERPFLWAIRDTTCLPDGFRQRTSAHGLIVSWAPQTQVLEHAAVGGFLTHCGWNSTVESIHMGVPMLCHPLIGDQILSASLISNSWGLGVGLTKEDSLVTSREVQKGIGALMSSRQLHSNASEWKAASHRAIQQAGSSERAFQALIQDLTVTIEG